MLHGKRIEHCPFIPFVIPHAKSVNYHKISKILEYEDIKPHLIYLVNGTFEDPPYVDCIDIHILYFRNYREPKSTYYDFLDLSFEIIANSPDNKVPLIGVASRSTPDFCEYFIARWLMNECGYSTNEALNLVRQSLPPGIIKKKFLHQLSKLNFKFEKPIRKEEEISNSTDQNTTTNEISQIPYSVEKETENLEINSQSAAPTNATEIQQDQTPGQVISNSENQEKNEIQNVEPISSTPTSIQTKEQEVDQQQNQSQIQFEESRVKEQKIQPQQQQQSNEPSENYLQQHHQQLQIQIQQRQQQQQQIHLLQSKAQEFYQYQNQVKQRLQEFQSSPYEYQQQNISYKYQLQNNLNEVSKLLQPIELQIQQLKASQQQQQQQQQISPKQIIKSSSGPILHSDSFSIDTKIQPADESVYNSSTSITSNASSSNIQSQLQEIEQPVPPQHVSMYFNEIVKMMNVPHKKSLFTKFSPITLSQLELIKNELIINSKEVEKGQSEPHNYCLMPEPEGIRALLYLRRKIPLLIFQNYSPIQLKLEINTSDDDLYIFEVILIRYCQSNIVLCDVMFAKDEDVSSRPFNYRIGIVKSCYDSIFEPLNSSLIKFTIRPFYKLKDYRLLTQLFENPPKKKFSKYPLVGISATLINSGNCHSSKCMFLWTKNVIENPRVIIEIDFGSKIVFGFAQNGTTSAIIAYLGKLTPDIFNLNGKVVEIEVLDQDPEWTNILNAKIIKLSDGYPWTTDKFTKYYPEREPHMDVHGLNSMLEMIASIH